MWGISVVLAALVALAGFTVAGGPPPQAGTVFTPNQAGPLQLG
jgi:hypothetical protein